MFLVLPAGDELIPVGQSRRLIGSAAVRTRRDAQLDRNIKWRMFQSPVHAKSNEVKVTQSSRPPRYDEIMKVIANGKRYILGLFTAGTSRDQDEETSSRIQQQHLEYLFKLRAEGKLILNGPLTDDSPIRGICIFALEDTDEAGRLMSNDPAVKAGRLNWEVHPWFGLPGDGLK